MRCSNRLTGDTERVWPCAAIQYLSWGSARPALQTGGAPRAPDQPAHQWRNREDGVEGGQRQGRNGHDKVAFRFDQARVKDPQSDTHGVDLLNCVHAWRGSTAPVAGRCPAPGDAVSVVLTADGCSLPSVPSWLGPPPFPGSWPDPVFCAWWVRTLVRTVPHPRMAWIYWVGCLPASARACGNWKALLTS